MSLAPNCPFFARVISAHVMGLAFLGLAEDEERPESQDVGMRGGRKPASFVQCHAEGGDHEEAMTGSVRSETGKALT